MVDNLHFNNSLIKVLLNVVEKGELSVLLMGLVTQYKDRVKIPYLSNLSIRGEI